jgi:hypothetical protein
MFHWLRSRRPASPAPSARLGTELALSDRITPCAGHDMMAAASVVAPPNPAAAQAQAVAPSAPSEVPEGQGPSALVAPPVALPPEVQQAIPVTPPALPPETEGFVTTDVENPPAAAAPPPRAADVPGGEAEFTSN